MREFIEAKGGYILTDGKIYGKRIYLAKGQDKSGFTEITEAKYETILQNEFETI